MMDKRKHITTRRSSRSVDTVVIVLTYLLDIGMKIPIIGSFLRICLDAGVIVWNHLWDIGLRIPILKSFLRTLLSLYGTNLPIYRDVTPGINVFSVITGNTLGSHESFWTLLAKQINLVKVPSVEDCDVILAVCPIVSRVGTDIEAALSFVPACRPAVLVVFHHTNDESYVVPNTSRFAKGRDIQTVDCLFNDDGLLRTCQNDEALRHAVEYLKPYQKNKTMRH